MAQQTAPGDQPVVSGRTGDRSDRVVFADHGASHVTVTRTSGAAALYVTTDGSAPTSNGPWRWVLRADDPALTIPVPPAESVVVRLHASEPVDYDVQAL
ncbi:hypothetical protein ACUN7V_15495 [Quadrisphaera oryzae]|uniref:hypothetical protein n=1 Tax=Quadrisphaera TaxID=317661 RepID=UPI0016482CA6|nr:hypothetical protein [Quadrisphaera sp. RL12-1S]MBC3760615.1 hypothetical protein [Quadrisphaera sp. RL12-1S]